VKGRLLGPDGILKRAAFDKANPTLAIAAFCVRCKCPTGTPGDDIEDSIRSCSTKQCHWFAFRPYQLDVKPKRPGRDG